jgi:hypothetical protein
MYMPSLGKGPNKGLGPLLRRYNEKNAKLRWSHIKIYFSRTTVSEKLCFTQKTF